jgi:tetratricopeptide (TPR) repeat protein
MTFLVRLLSLVNAFLCCAALSGCMPGTRSGLDEEKEPHFLKGKSRVSAMDYRGAVDEYVRALEDNPRSAAAHFELAWLYDQKEPDPAAAIYHYERFLKLQPTSGKAEAARTRILACKQELAKGILPAATPGVQRDLDQLAAEIARLRDEVDRWRLYAARMQMPTNPPSLSDSSPRVAQADPNPQGGLNMSSGAVQSERPSAPAGGRTHTVQSGETAYSISRKYGVPLDALLSANPGLDTRRMRPGQIMTIPPL